MVGLFPFNRKELFILALCWTHLIFYGCCIPGTEMPEIRFDFIIQYDKLVHFIFFLIFFLIWSGVRRYSYIYGLLLILIGSFYGLFIEFFQFNFVDGRGFESADFVADLLGTIVGFVSRPFLGPFFIKTIDNG